MKITILCVGKVKESFMREAVGEYRKRLSRYVKLDIVEVADERTTRPKRKKRLSGRKRESGFSEN